MVAESIKQYSTFVLKQRNLSSEPKSQSVSDFDIDHPVIQESENVTPPPNIHKSVDSYSSLETKESFELKSENVNNIFNPAKENQHFNKKFANTQARQNSSDKKVHQISFLVDEVVTNARPQKVIRSHRIQKVYLSFSNYIIIFF